MAGLNSGFSNNKNVIALGAGNVTTLYTDKKLSSSVAARTLVKRTISAPRVFKAGDYTTDGQPDTNVHGEFGPGGVI